MIHFPAIEIGDWKLCFKIKQFVLNNLNFLKNIIFAGFFHISSTPC